MRRQRNPHTSGENRNHYTKGYHAKVEFWTGQLLQPDGRYSHERVMQSLSYFLSKQQEWCEANEAMLMAKFNDACRAGHGLLGAQVDFMGFGQQATLHCRDIVTAQQNKPQS